MLIGGTDFHFSQQVGTTDQLTNGALKAKQKQRGVKNRLKRLMLGYRYLYGIGQFRGRIVALQKLRILLLSFCQQWTTLKIWKNVALRHFQLEQRETLPIDLPNFYKDKHEKCSTIYPWLLPLFRTRILDFSPNPDFGSGSRIRIQVTKNKFFQSKNKILRLIFVFNPKKQVFYFCFQPIKQVPQVFY